MRKLFTHFRLLLTALFISVIHFASAQAPSSSTPADNATNVSVQPGSFHFQWQQPYQVSLLPSNLDQVYLRRSDNATNITTFNYDNDTRSLTMTPFLGLSTANLASQLDPFTTYELIATGFDNINFANVVGVYDENTRIRGGWSPNDGSLVTFSTGADNINPSLTRKIPVASDPNVSPSTTQISLTFDEVVVPGTGNIELRRFSDNVVMESIAIGAATFSQNISPLPRTTVTVPLTALTSSTQYYVHMPTGVIKDDSNNDYAGITDKSYSFTTGVGDTRPPEIVDFIPVNGAQNIRLTQTFIGIDYDEQISVGTGQAELRDAANNLVASLTPYIGNGELRFSLTSTTLNPGTTYSLYLPEGVGKDLADNPTPELTLNTYQFTTTIPPTVTNLTPENNATGLSTSINSVTVTFSEPIFFDPNGTGGNVWIDKDGSWIKLYVMDGSDPDIEFDGLDMHINNLPALDPNTTYQVRLTGALTTYIDADGNGIPNIPAGEWTFTTGAGGDVTPPTVFSRNPSAGALDVPADELFTITFNEDIQAPTSTNSGYIRIKRQSDDTQITVISYSTQSITNGFLSVTNNAISFNRDNLPVGTACYISIDDNAIKDIAGNGITNLDNTTSWAFTTSSDNPPPAILTKTPATTTNNVPLNQTFTVTFDQNIILEGGEIIVLLLDGETPYFYRENDANVSSVDNELTFTLPLIENSKTYNIRLANIQNAAGNEIAITPEGDWVFTTAAPDVTKPTIDSAVPVKSSNNVDVNLGTIVLTMTEPVNRGPSGGFRLRQSGGGDPVVKQWNVGDASDLTVSGNTITLAGIPEMQGGTMHYLQFTGFSNSITDDAGNFLDSWTLSTVYNFVTADPPAIVNIPDANFKSYLVGNNSINTNGDTEIQVSEAEAFTGQISAGNLGINDLTGIEAFPNLTELYVNNNNLSNLDLSNNLLLTDINVNYNDLSTLDLSNHANLITVFARANASLSALNLSASSSTIERINARECAITSFELDGAINLTSVELGYNALTNVSITNSSISTNLFLNINDLTTVDFTGTNVFDRFLINGNTNLTMLDISDMVDVQIVDANGTSITELDLSANVNLRTINVANCNLSSLSVKNGNNSNISSFDARGNANLTCINVDDVTHFETNFSGNVDAGVSFSTTCNNDVSPPVVNSTSPSDEGTFAPLSGGGGIVFNEAVQQAAGTIELYLADGTLIESIPTGVNDTRLGQPADFRITWDFNTDLVPSTAYYILVSEGAYEDLAGNPFAGIGVGELDFTANARPLIEALLPLDDATDIAIDASLTLDLDEDMYVDGAVQLIIKDFASDNTFASFDLSALDMGEGAGTFLNGIITVNPASDFDNSTQYYVVLEGAGSLRSSFNAESFIGLQNKSDWNFTTVNAKTDQTITFDALAAKTFGDTAFELTATSSSNLTVSYASSNTSVATVDGNMLTIVGAGSTIITASQEGNNDFNAAAPVQQELIVNKAAQTITFEQLEDQLLEDQSVEVIANSNANLEVTFEVSSGPATLSGNTLTFTDLGTVEVVASQAGNQNYMEASATMSFKVISACESFSASASIIQPISCADASDGSFELTVSGGKAPFTYEMGGSSQSENLFQNMSAGTYEVTIMDANGCSAIVSVELIAPEALAITAEVENSTSIFGNGSISITVTGGTGQYTYAWSNGAATASLTELEIGEYSLTVTDENGCSLSETFTVGGVTANIEEGQAEWSFYPNPAINSLQVQHSEDATQLSIYDLSGKQLLEQKLEGKSSVIEVSQLPTGVYQLKINGNAPKRFIKK
ncbi:Ig-like domain-containing protein [Marivirga arenosa]|uniref:Ig-like domain-containing protein n=1 Tax=Marivirga arenosa TaxID=3059076 RepID=A0AA51R7Q3_9BACT|nr:Ig-like domain-containing protein [Marivirga sp. ABR2-2]WMN07867.1 Ig-like domain-containing protein [Marivirga sp. ABR2-2]